MTIPGSTGYYLLRLGGSSSERLSTRPPASQLTNRGARIQTQNFRALRYICLPLYPVAATHRGRKKYAGCPSEGWRECRPHFRTHLTNPNSKTKKVTPLTDEWIKKMWYIYTMEYYSALKKNEIMPWWQHGWIMDG